MGEGGASGEAWPAAARFSCPSPAPSPSLLFPSYGRVYAATDPYHHTIGPTATYSIGTMVRTTALSDEEIHPVLGWVGPGCRTRLRPAANA